MINGNVTSAELCTPLSGVHILVLDRDNNILSQHESDSTGCFELPENSKDATALFTRDGYTSKTIPVTLLQSNQPVRLLESRLIGYLDKLWALPGDLVPVYIHAPFPCQATLYRHGIKKQQCATAFRSCPAQLQAVPDGFFVENGLSWQVSFHMQIPKNATPGLYSILLESEDQEPFAMPLIVATPQPDRGKRSQLLVLASNTTWQSYNLWGGRSRYRNFETAITRDYKREYLPFIKNLILQAAECIPLKIRLKLKQFIGKGHPDWMFKRLSIKRPFTNCFLEQESPETLFTNHLAAGEWRVLAWLEKNNIPYDFVPGQFLHEHADLLSCYKAIMLNTHCEYWSSQMYHQLKYQHQQQGLWILNISGNAIYREIDYFKDGSTRCVSLFFEESCADETEVLGVRFTEDDYGTAAPCKITDPDHWIYNGIRLPEDGKFAKITLNQWTEKTYDRYDPGRPGLASGLKGIGGSGWETDKLSKTAAKDFFQLAKGLNKKGGADLVIREPEGTRGGVFSVSSITFGGSLLIDDVCSGMVRNVLKRVLK